MKDFDFIQGDYDFFCRHSTEKEKNLKALEKMARDLARGKSGIRVLDFGCGSGDFSFELFQRTLEKTTHLHLCLVDPSERYLHLAEQLFVKRRNTTLHVCRQFDEKDKERYDLILSNHVLYYVKDLNHLFGQFHRAAHLESRILVTLAGEKHGLQKILESFCQSEGIENPFLASEKLKEFLIAKKIQFESNQIKSELSFEDTAKHRQKILRFVLGALIPSGGDLPMELLDPFQKESRILVPLEDEVFQIVPNFGSIEFLHDEKRQRKKIA